MILFAEDETPTPAPLMLADLPEDIRPTLPRATFGIARRDDTGTGYSIIASLTLTVEQLRNWEYILAGSAYRFLLSPDCA
jgi:hypothetical protein